MPFILDLRPMHTAQSAMVGLVLTLSRSLLPCHLRRIRFSDARPSLAQPLPWVPQMITDATAAIICPLPPPPVQSLERSADRWDPPSKKLAQDFRRAAGTPFHTKRLPHYWESRPGGSSER